TSTLQGHFLDYQATFEHLDPLGMGRVSVIDGVEIHELVHVVRVSRPGDDALPDFLVNDVPDDRDSPDTLYLSDGTKAPVVAASSGSVDGSVSRGHLAVQLTATMAAGWSYLEIPDPGVGFRLARVVRSDGTELRLGDNAWTTDRSFPDNADGQVRREHLLHLF